jgi:hypothetical protein
MKSVRTIVVALGIATLAACGGSGSEEANTADANVALEGENLDAGLNATDINAVDANLGADLNAGADANLTTGNDANASDATNATNNAG